MGVQVLDKSFLILETLSREISGMTVSDLSEAVGLNISTVHRILATFTERGYVQQDHQKRYSLSLKFLELAASYLNGLDLKTVAESTLQELADSLEQTVFLATEMDEQVVYINRFQTTGNLRRYAVIGERQPMFCTALGKSLLTGFSHKDLKQYAQNCPFEKRASKTIMNAEALLEDVECSRTRGWSHDDEEFVDGICCFAAAIYDYRSHVIAALSVSLNKENLSALGQDKIISSLLDSSSKISRIMGYRKER